MSIRRSRPHRIIALGVSALMAACRGAHSIPPAPDYAQPAAWAAWPGRPGEADSVPQGITGAPLPAEQMADVFFIHPTTDLSFRIGNARYDEPGGASTRIDHGVLRYQASTFNACCRIYAPHYRQATIGVFMRANATEAEAAFDLAYGDVLNAFDYYVAHENHGRPFIIASHSQGSLHAQRLLLERVVGKPLQGQLVAAYVIGHAVPLAIEHAGLPVCRSAEQTGCLIDWNTVDQESEPHSPDKRGLVWLEGSYRPAGTDSLVCVNPLNWLLGASAPAALNLGALPAARGRMLPQPIPGLTGASCNGARLEVDIPRDERAGFRDALSAFGSYHVFDYNLFYMNIRANAQARVVAFRAASHH
jgi:hypothetical protein